MNYFAPLFAIPLFFATSAVAQEEPRVYFRGEGGGDRFTLFWGPEVWPEDLRGFLVKRKQEGSERWVTLSKNVITPATDDPDRLEYVTGSFAEQERLKRVYDSLVTYKKIRVMTPEQMYDTFLSGSETIAFLTFLASIEFDFALVHGFAYVDAFIPEASGYTYGIFPVYYSTGAAAEPLHTVDWIYGEKETIALKANGSVERLSSEGLKASWQFSTAELKAEEVVGFHIYIQGLNTPAERLTERPIRVNMAGSTTDLIQLDKERDAGRKWTYYAVPVNLFETEGPSLVAEWDPAASPASGQSTSVRARSATEDVVEKPGIPEGLRASVIKERGKEFIFLRWNPKRNGDGTAGYHLWTPGIMSDAMALEGSIGLLEKNMYKWEIKTYDKEYTFAVSRVMEDGSETAHCQPIKIKIPPKGG